MESCLLSNFSDGGLSPGFVNVSPTFREQPLIILNVVDQIHLALGEEEWDGTAAFDKIGGWKLLLLRHFDDMHPLLQPAYEQRA